MGMMRYGYYYYGGDDGGGGDGDYLSCVCVFDV